MNFEIALVFVGAMAMHTGGFQDGFDLLIEVDFLGDERRREGKGGYEGELGRSEKRHPVG